MSKGTTFVPLSQSVSVVDSNTYSQKRDNYIHRLERELDDFYVAREKIIKARAERLRYEEQRRNEKERKRARQRDLIRKILRVFFTLVIIFGSLAALFRFVIWPKLPSTKYSNAMELLSEQKLLEAYNIFNEIDYKDSANIAGKIRMDVISSQLTNAKVGDTIIMGNYLQDSESKKHYEDIEWIVLDKQDNKLLIVSKYALASSKYFDWNMFSSTWEESIIRTWLNGEFYNSAFNSDEMEMILTTLVETPSSVHNIDGGNSTNDKLFCLSVEEAKMYFSSNEERVVESKQKSNGEGVCWWLRTPGERGYYSAYVSESGQIDVDGENQFSTLTVRPAMWLEIPE